MRPAYTLIYRVLAGGREKEPIQPSNSLKLRILCYPFTRDPLAMNYPNRSDLNPQAFSVLLLLVVGMFLLYNKGALTPGSQALVMGGALWLARPLAEGALRYLWGTGLALCGLLLVLTGVEFMLPLLPR